VIRWSTETIFTPRAAACATTELSAVALDGLMMIAFAPAEIRLRMSAFCSAARERLRLDRADHLLAPAVAHERVADAEHVLLPARRLRARRAGETPDHGHRRNRQYNEQGANAPANLALLHAYSSLS
jgi:hypothetical protein